MMGAFVFGMGSGPLERMLEKDMSSAARLGVLAGTAEAVAVGVSAGAGSGFNIEGSEGAGVGVWRLAAEPSDGARRREGGDARFRALLVGLGGSVLPPRPPCLGCECECECE